jgi:hypothetical protein
MSHSAPPDPSDPNLRPADPSLRPADEAHEGAE